MVQILLCGGAVVTLSMGIRHGFGLWLQPITQEMGWTRVEPVKQRPGMYTRTDNPLHVLQEVIDNAADEALAGFGKKIRFTLHSDVSYSVRPRHAGRPRSCRRRPCPCRTLPPTLVRMILSRFFLRT